MTEIVKLCIDCQLDFKARTTGIQTDRCPECRKIHTRERARRKRHLRSLEHGLGPINRAPSSSTQSWTDERVDLLKELWGDGLPASQIARKLTGVSRSAVIGKAHRLGLSEKSIARRPEKVQRRTRAQKTSPALRFGAPRDVYQKHQPNAGMKSLIRDWPRKVGIDIMDLELNSCRYPYNGGEVTYCGCDSVPGTSWCEEHLAVVSAPVPVRKRKSVRRVA